MNTGQGKLENFMLEYTLEFHLKDKKWYIVDQTKNLIFGSLPIYSVLV